jgi:DegV family protein with EDD domain
VAGHQEERVGGVAVVTDSTADLPRELVEELGLRVVPLSVSFGTETFASGITIDPTGFYERLAAERTLPTTSQPAPVWFEEAYADCLDDGVDAVVSVHCSGALSGTVDLARDRARRAGLRVEVVDSRLVSGALGLTVLAGHRAAAGGADVDEVLAAIDRTRREVTTLVVVDTLDYLKRGGRLTGAQALVGRALKVKPLLHIVEGRVEVMERTRTWARALERLVVVAEEAAAGRRVDVVVAHAVVPDRAAEVWAALEARLSIGDRLETLMGPVVGTHVGPGAIGIALVPSDAGPTAAA